MALAQTDFALDGDALADWIAANAGFSGAAIGGSLAGGNANLTLRVDTDQGPLVLRTPPVDTVSPKAHRGISREARVMKALAGKVRVPQVLGFCDDAAVIGRPFLLVEMIDGVSLTDTLPTSYAGDAQAVNLLGKQLVDELAAIHLVPWESVGLSDFGNPEQFLQRQIMRWREHRQAQDGRRLAEFEELGQWLHDNQPAEGPVGIVHGDYHLDNALCRDDKPELAAVIDWELATIGDPLTDLGLFLMFWGPRKVKRPGFGHVQAVTRGAGVIGRRELAQRWAQATGLSLEHLDFYLCFAFWRLAAIVEGAYELYVAGRVDTAYARGLEYDVPALLAEAKLAATGDW